MKKEIKELTELEKARNKFEQTWLDYKLAVKVMEEAKTAWVSAGVEVDAITEYTNIKEN